MRVRILSSVLLPAPLRPMIPITSPRSTSNVTSLSAQNVCLLAWIGFSRRAIERATCQGRLMESLSVSASVRSRAWSAPMRYCLPSPAIWIARVLFMPHTTSANVFSIRRK